MKGPGTRLPGAERLVATGAGLSHRGRVREINEDALLTDPSGALWVVADGMGGHGHGDLAADLVIDALARLPHGGGGPALLRQGLAAAHDAIGRRARAGGLGPIGATVVALLIEDRRATIAWAGDARAYLWRDGALEPLTRDHSQVQEMLDRGEIAPDEVRGHALQNVVTRAVGVGALDPAFAELDLRRGDRLLLCSDGLSHCLVDAEIAAELAAAADPAEACRRLVEATLARGAPDNVSAVVVRIDWAAA